MIPLRCRAPGKINLALFVGRPRRDDGYHPLVSLVQPLSLADEIRLEPGDGSGDEVVCPGVEAENLAARALAAFRAATGWDHPPVRLTIHKRVPVAAGMGGGSADAAATLRLLTVAAGRAPADLIGLAARLGADVPSQLAPERCLMTGIGESVRPLGPPPSYGALIVPLPFALATPSVYAEFDRLALGRTEAELAERAAGILAGPLVNDLEPAARSLCPAIAGALEDVHRAGAEHALVSGSGPTVFGLFRRLEDAEVAAAELRDSYPAAVAAKPVDARFAAPEELVA